MSETRTIKTHKLFEGHEMPEIIKLLASMATRKGFSFAFYRMPEQSEFRFLASDSLPKVEKEDLELLDKGFLISSYEGDHYFLKQDLHYSSETDNCNLKELIDEAHTDIDLVWEPYIQLNSEQGTNKQDFVKNVIKCQDEISNSELIKVVPSKTKRIKLDQKSLSTVFVNLCEAYPTAFVSLTSSPALGTWVGATPESLIEVNKDGIFKTMSLAGTQPYNGSQPLHTLPWTQKEIEEQAMVSRYIINRFKEIRLREFIEVGPRTTSAGNMAHLCTIFSVDTVTTEFQNLGSVMLKILHPTSAVCGMPKLLAQELIHKIEKHERRLFSGYLGPVNMEEGSYLYVNLRCMEMQEGQAILYAGAGVTAYSIPEDEWDETELKCNTLLDVIDQ